MVKSVDLELSVKPSKIAAASSLIRGMLTVSAEKRATVTDICGHPWINEVSSPLDQEIHPTYQSSTVLFIQSFARF